MGEMRSEKGPGRYYKTSFVFCSRESVSRLTAKCAIGKNLPPLFKKTYFSQGEDSS